LVSLKAEPSHADTHAMKNAELPAAHSRLSYLVGAVGLMSLVISAYLANFTKFAFDDFELAERFHEIGWWPLSKLMFAQYSGRIVLILFGGAFTGLGPGFARWAGSVMILGFWCATSSAIHFGIERMGRMMPWRQSALFGASVTGALLLTTAQRFQTFRWVTGLLVYGLPVVLGIGGLALALRRGRRGPASAACFVASLVMILLSSGGNESQALIQPFVCLVCAVAALRKREGTAGSKARALSYLVFSVCGAAILFFSPGSKQRAGWLSVSHEPKVLIGSCWRSLLVIGAVTTGSIVGLAALFALGRMMSLFAPRMETKANEIKQVRFVQRTLLGATLAALVATITIPAYALNDPAPLRAYLPLQIVFGALVLVSGWRSVEIIGPVGRWKVDPELLRIIPGVVLVVALSGPISLAATEFGHVPIAAKNSRHFDCIDRSLRSQFESGVTDAVVFAPELIEDINFLYADSSIRPNVVTSSYYGLATITASPGDPCASIGAGPE
jgi:hypothetical protein